MAMEHAFLSEKARDHAAERHAAEMRDVVHVLSRNKQVLPQDLSSAQT
jgi:hypothetical protein